MAVEPTYAELLAACQHSAVHLELRDFYMLDDPFWLTWQKTRHFDMDDRASWYDPYYDLMTAAVRRGVRVRRARLVSEPVHDYIKFEHALSAIHVAGGEEVRYLPRPLAKGLRLPANDFWLYDGEVMKSSYFSGVGDVVGRELIRDPEWVRFNAEAFEEIWERAIPQHEYEPR